jgi:uncharacterized membrane protein YqjE
VAILQALIAFVGRSASKILNAIFGWAVRALFGTVSGAEAMLLTGVVAIAAAWPLLLLGVLAPRLAAFAIAFVPVPKSVPESTIRAVWIALALIVPALVGLALAMKSPLRGESFGRKLARGYPTTMGLSAAFWINFIRVPLVHLAGLAHGKTETHVPLITKGDGYHQAGERVRAVLNDRGYELVEAKPGFGERASTAVLRKLAGAALRGYVPETPIHFRGPRLEVALYPSSLMFRGREEVIAPAHGLVVEALTSCDAFQTTDPSAQEIEREIRRVWQIFDENPAAHTRSAVLESRLADISREIAALSVNYEDWQVLYRQALQLGRAIEGEGQLLAKTNDRTTHEGTMKDTKSHQVEDDRAAARSPSAAEAKELSLPDLVREIGGNAVLLAKKEIELARAELTEQVKSELALVKAFAVAAVTGLTAVNLLFVAAVFALLPYARGWVSALALAGAMLVVTAVAAMIGWRKHVSRPLTVTRKTLKEDAQWAKEQLA